MRAKILRKGKTVSIYILNKKGRSEIEGFFFNKQSKNQYKGIISGLQIIINFIADNGYQQLPKEQFKCFKSNKRHHICELMKGQHRISCFKHEGGSKLLLVSHFVKQRKKENLEYERAIGMNKRFSQNPIWED